MIASSQIEMVNTIGHPAFESSVVDEAARFIRSLFQKHLPPQMSFHNIEHTERVVQAAREMGTYYKLSNKYMEVLLLAAWFHDSGHVRQYEGHETVSIFIARSFLTRLHYPVFLIKKVVNCIAATELRKEPVSLIEKILCDADLMHLASPDYLRWQNALRCEWKVVLKKVYNRKEWATLNYNFMKSHLYHTSYARFMYRPGKERNLQIFAEKFGRPT